MLKNHPAADILQQGSTLFCGQTSSKCPLLPGDLGRNLFPRRGHGVASNARSSWERGDHLRGAPGAASAWTAPRWEFLQKPTRYWGQRKPLRRAYLWTFRAVLLGEHPDPQTAMRPQYMVVDLEFSHSIYGFCLTEGPTFIRLSLTAGRRVSSREEIPRSPFDSP